MKNLVIMLCVLVGCAGSDEITERVIQNVGLLSVVIPPKGIGVAPISGYPGAVPASIPAASVGANGTPGSISPYGGQWVLPLPVSPGAKIANVSCDMVSNSSTVVTMELVGRTVVTSKIFGPANNVFATVWLVPTDNDPNGYTVGDGEHVAVRLSFRDSATGGWSTGVQQVPVVGCAVNATSALTAPLPTATTYITVPGSFFAQPDIHVGINGQVYQIPVSTGQFTSASMTAQCASSGFIVACARIRERGTWDWCSKPVACVGTASASVPLVSPIALTSTAHVDIALMSGPTVATSPFGVYTTM